MASNNLAQFDSMLKLSKPRPPLCADCARLIPNAIVFEKIESIIKSIMVDEEGLFDSRRRMSKTSTTIPTTINQSDNKGGNSIRKSNSVSSSSSSQYSAAVSSTSFTSIQQASTITSTATKNQQQEYQQKFQQLSPASIFTGAELIQWMVRHLDLERGQQEAAHLANLIAAYGYIFPVQHQSHHHSHHNPLYQYHLNLNHLTHHHHHKDHHHQHHKDHHHVSPYFHHLHNQQQILAFQVKNDNTMYCFQAPYLWPSNWDEPENLDYAVYLCKRSLMSKQAIPNQNQRRDSEASVTDSTSGGSLPTSGPMSNTTTTTSTSTTSSSNIDNIESNSSISSSDNKAFELADFEVETLSRLQRVYSGKWRHISEEAQQRLANERKSCDKLEQRVLEMQERAFWAHFKPFPGCLSGRELDMKKICRLAKVSRNCAKCRQLLSSSSSSSEANDCTSRSSLKSLQQHQFRQSNAAGSLLDKLNNDDQPISIFVANLQAASMASFEQMSNIETLAVRRQSNSAQSSFVADSDRDRDQEIGIINDIGSELRRVPSDTTLLVHPRSSSKFGQENGTRQDAENGGDNLALLSSSSSRSCAVDDDKSSVQLEDHRSTSTVCNSSLKIVDNDGDIVNDDQVDGSNAIETRGKFCNPTDHQLFDNRLHEIGVGCENVTVTCAQSSLDRIAKIVPSLDANNSDAHDINGTKPLATNLGDTDILNASKLNEGPSKTTSVSVGEGGDASYCPNSINEPVRGDRVRDQELDQDSQKQIQQQMSICVPLASNKRQPKHQPQNLEDDQIISSSTCGSGVMGPANKCKVFSGDEVFTDYRETPTPIETMKDGAGSYIPEVLLRCDTIDGNGEGDLTSKSSKAAARHDIAAEEEMEEKRSLQQLHQQPSTIEENNGDVINQQQQQKHRLQPLRRQARTIINSPDFTSIAPDATAMFDGEVRCHSMSESDHQYGSNNNQDNECNTRSGSNRLPIVTTTTAPTTTSCSTSAIDDADVEMKCDLGKMKKPVEEMDHQQKHLMKLADQLTLTENPTTVAGSSTSNNNKQFLSSLTLNDSDGGSSSDSVFKRENSCPASSTTLNNKLTGSEEARVTSSSSLSISKQSSLKQSLTNPLGNKIENNFLRLSGKPRLSNLLNYDGQRHQLSIESQPNLRKSSFDLVLNRSDSSASSTNLMQSASTTSTTTSGGGLHHLNTLLHKTSLHHHNKPRLSVSVASGSGAIGVNVGSSSSTLSGVARLKNSMQNQHSFLGSLISWRQRSESKGDIGKTTSSSSGVTSSIRSHLRVGGGSFQASSAGQLLAGLGVGVSTSTGGTSPPSPSSSLRSQFAKLERLGSGSHRSSFSYCSTSSTSSTSPLYRGSSARMATTGDEFSMMLDLDNQLQLPSSSSVQQPTSKADKITQSYVTFARQWQDYDPFLTQPIPSNPWLSDSSEFWDLQSQTKEVNLRRVKRWAFSLRELLQDPAGRDQFSKFLEKEFSAENLKFWEAVQQLKRVRLSQVPDLVRTIWNDFLSNDAISPINIDSKSFETTKANYLDCKTNNSANISTSNNRNTTIRRDIYDEAANHVYLLMRNDSYPRYLRSDSYKEYLRLASSEKKRSQIQVSFDVFKAQAFRQRFNSVVK